MGSPFVSEQALAETYDLDTGWETVTQYREAIRLRRENPGMARAEIARRVGRSASAVRGWLAEGKTPRVVSGLKTANERGWIDIDAESEQFRALNQLVAWLFSGGGLRMDAYVPLFSVDNSLMLAILSQLLRWARIDYRCREPDEPDGHLEVVPTEGGAVLGRVLSVLGAPQGVKADIDDLTLPAYLSTVGCDYRRDFARIYLLNRSHDFETANTDGTVMCPTPSEPYCREVCDLFDTVTSGTATLGSQHRVWVSAAAVRDLAGETPLRSALATAALHGSLTPPTERAIGSTFRRSETPGGYRYHQLYRTIREREDSRATLAAETGLPESTIQSWRRGAKPYVTNALTQATERGWLTPPADSETATALIGLLTWLLAAGSLRETYLPVFGAPLPAQQKRFESIATTLELDYNTVQSGDPNRPTEIRPAEDGTLLGRVLYTLGAPRQTEPQTTALLPPVVYHYRRYARQVAEIWCLHHASETDRGLTIAVPPRVSDRFPDALATLFSERLAWTVEQYDRELLVTDRSNDPVV
ncbi:MAG: helix-turn-helix domain-containing protein [Halapricum sp.]